MRPVLLVAAVLAAALLAGWLLRTPSTPPGAPTAEERPAEEPPAPGEPAPSSPSLTAEPRPAPPPAPRGPARPAPPVTGKAELVVVPVPPEGGQVPGDLRVVLERVGGRLSTHPLPLAQDDGSLRYRDLLPGAYRVRLFSDVLVDAVAEATLKDGASERIEVPLQPGGYARVTVTLYNGESPAQVTYALRDDKGQPVRARFEGRTPDGPTTSPKVADSATLPAAVVVVGGLRPGGYTIRATSPADEFEEETFEVKAGEGVTLAIKVRK